MKNRILALALDSDDEQDGDTDQQSEQHLETDDEPISPTESDSFGIPDSEEKGS